MHLTNAAPLVLVKRRRGITGQFACDSAAQRYANRPAFKCVFVFEKKKRKRSLFQRSSRLTGSFHAFPASLMRPRPSSWPLVELECLARRFIGLYELRTWRTMRQHRQRNAHNGTHTHDDATAAYKSSHEQRHELRKYSFGDWRHFSCSLFWPSTGSHFECNPAKL